MTQKVQERNARLERLAVWCTYIALFFNPLGFDFVQYWLLELTGSIWAANLMLYIIAGVFFVLSSIFRKMKKEPEKDDKYKKENTVNIHFLDENT